MLKAPAADLAAAHTHATLALVRKALHVAVYRIGQAHLLDRLIRRHATDKLLDAVTLLILLRVCLIFLRDDRQIDFVRIDTI